MTQDDIIRMAREAGCLGPGPGGDPHGLWEPNGWEDVTDLMHCFAQLVAAAEREKCAKVCEEIGRGHSSAIAEFDCAAAIRARSADGS